jgi:hypothetical protein
MSVLKNSSNVVLIQSIFEKIQPSIKQTAVEFVLMETNKSVVAFRGKSEIEDFKNFPYAFCMNCEKIAISEFPQFCSSNVVFYVTYYNSVLSQCCSRVADCPGYTVPAGLCTARLPYVTHHQSGTGHVGQCTSIRRVDQLKPPSGIVLSVRLKHC